MSSLASCLKKAFRSDFCYWKWCCHVLSLNHQLPSHLNPAAQLLPVVSTAVFDDALHSVVTKLVLAYRIAQHSAGLVPTLFSLKKWLNKQFTPRTAQYQCGQLDTHRNAQVSICPSFCTLLLSVIALARCQATLCLSFLVQQSICQIYKL